MVTERIDTHPLLVKPWLAYTRDGNHELPNNALIHNFFETDIVCHFTTSLSNKCLDD